MKAGFCEGPRPVVSPKEAARRRIKGSDLDKTAVGEELKPLTRIASSDAKNSTALAISWLADLSSRDQAGKIFLYASCLRAAAEQLVQACCIGQAGV